MPDSSFSQQMAEMIARARPPQAPSGGRGRVVMGGGGMGSLGGTERSQQTNVAVELGPWMRLFGVKTPEEKRQIGEKFVSQRGNYSDEDWENMVNQPPTQKILGGAQEAGVPGIIKEGPGYYGASRYNVAKPTEEAMTAGKAKEEIIARGGRPAERLTAFTKETRPKAEHEIFAAGGPEAATLLKNLETQARQKAEASETPVVKGVHIAQADMYTGAGEASRAGAKKDIEMLKYLPEEQTRATQESAAKVIALNAEAVRNRAQAEYFLAEAKAKKEEAKESNILLKGSIDAYRTSQSAWIGAYAKGSIEERTSLMGILTATTDRYISSVSTLKRPELGNDALSFWLSSTNDELSSSLEPTTGKLPTVGKGPLGIGVLAGITAVQPRKDMLFQQRASQIVSFMQTMGKSIDDNAAYKSLDLFTRIYGQTTHTPQMDNYAALMVEVGKALGYPMTTLSNLITPPKVEPLEVPLTGGQ